MQAVVQNDQRRRRVLMLGQLPPGNAERLDEPGPGSPLREADMPESVLQEFRSDCGMHHGYTIRVVSSESGHQSQTLRWDRPWLIIGSGRECDLQLSHAEVSRRHAYLQIVNGVIYCLDLGSRTGTHWSRGTNAAQAGRVEPGEPVSVGPFSLSIEREGDPVSGQGDSGVSGEGQSAIPMHLDFLNVGHEVRRWRVKRPVTLLGQSEPCKVRLGDESVSRVHASVVRTPRRLWVVDLCSEEGTLLEGRPIVADKLADGCEFQIGRYRIGVSYQPEDDDNETIQIAPEADSNRGTSGVELPLEDADLPGLVRVTNRVVARSRTGSRDHEGMSEQFVLNVIQELGTMQQQALEQMRESMTHAINSLASSYQTRIEHLEREQTELHSQLRGLPEPPRPQSRERRHSLPQFEEGTASEERSAAVSMPYESFVAGEGVHHDSPSGLTPPSGGSGLEPPEGSYECADPKLREAVLREQMKFIESEIGRSQKGWGKKLIDLLGS